MERGATSPFRHQRGLAGATRDDGVGHCHPVGAWRSGGPVKTPNAVSNEPGAVHDRPGQGPRHCARRSDRVRPVERACEHHHIDPFADLQALLRRLGPRRTRSGQTRSGAVPLPTPRDPGPIRGRSRLCRRSVRPRRGRIRSGAAPLAHEVGATRPGPRTACALPRLRTTEHPGACSRAEIPARRKSAGAGRLLSRGLR
jgi:hypothetical protein